MSFEEIWHEAHKDRSLGVDPEQLEQWLTQIPTEQYHYLEGQTTRTIHQTKMNVLQEHEQKEKMIEKLQMYKYVDDIQDVRLGSFVRWVKHDKKASLTNGGLVMKISFTDKGTYIVTKIGKKVTHFGLNQNHTFQKLTSEEWIVLMANEHS